MRIGTMDQPMEVQLMKMDKDLKKNGSFEMQGQKRLNLTMQDSSNSNRGKKRNSINPSQVFMVPQD